MTYEIKWDPRALQFLRKISKDISQRIVIKVGKLKETPFRYIIRIRGDKAYKLRIGDYRAIVDLYETEKKIKVRVVGHRKNIYKIYKRIA